MKESSRFIVVEHDAKRAKKHYDIRFKMPKSKNWASFACRKIPPIEVNQKILAVRTNDHSEKEALFIGKIESGYGAGTLKRWDNGNCSIEKYSSAHIAVEFEGSKLKGIYHFVSTGVVTKDFKGKSYFFFKGKVKLGG